MKKGTCLKTGSKVKGTESLGSCGLIRVIFGNLLGHFASLQDSRFQIARTALDVKLS